MSLKSHFELLASYNSWMNESLYLASQRLSSDELACNRGAYFGSIIGTLNHILVGDLIWLKRFAEHPSEFMALSYVKALKMPSSLDKQLYDNINDLFVERVKLDKIITAFCSEINEDCLSSTLTYKNTKGKLFHKKMSDLVLHLFNHQTHHRGQVSTLLNQQGIDIGGTDLLLKIPEVKYTLK
ncbi:damage-inducible protein DinB [Marinomonas agarivorans]|nr:damage-inducible protein DinB [Marinomonas agarivorans]